MAHKRARGRRVDPKGRSAGGGQHVRLHHWLLASPAYRSLTPAARALLVELMALYHGGNNGSLFLSVREAAKRLGIGKTLASRCFRDLTEKGFIRVVRQGAFNTKSAARRGDATAWLLTEFGLGGDKAGTRDFMRWRPAELDHQESDDGPRTGTRWAHTRTVGVKNCWNRRQVSALEDG